MVQPELAPADTEAEVVTTAPDVPEVEETQPENNPVDDLYPDDDGEMPQSESEQEEAEHEQDEEADAEPDKDPPIDAPFSLKAEEKEQFAHLPKEAQRMLSEVLQRRDRETREGLESARSEARQANAQAEEQVATAKAQFAETYDHLVRAFAPQPPNPELIHQDQNAYYYQKAIYEQQMEQFNQLAQGINSLRGESETFFKQQEQEANRARVQDMMSIPEFANEETRADFVKGIEAAGIELGYDPQSLALMDKRDMIAIQRASEWKAKAEKWDSHQKKRNERPRQAATGKFQVAPAGARVPAPKAVDPLAELYPDD